MTLQSFKILVGDEKTKNSALGTFPLGKITNFEDTFNEFHKKIVLTSKLIIE